LIRIVTPRLRLIPFGVALMKMALADRRQLESKLLAKIPDEWPNPDYAEALPFIIADLEAHPAKNGWMVSSHANAIMSWSETWD
jgi:hypothetical protein